MHQAVLFIEKIHQVPIDQNKNQFDWLPSGEDYGLHDS
jgi:hypothetical protein